MQTSRSLILAGLALAMTSFAVETKFWQQYEAGDYEKATLRNVSLRSDGRLGLAPVFKELYDASTAYLWAVAEDSKGNLYLGGGAPGANSAKLFQVDGSGKGKVLAELSGLEIHAIAVDQQDRVYAATSPDGKVYRVGSNGKAEVYYDPKAKYIWAMGFNRRGELFIATGDEGKVHRVGADGKGGVFFSADDTHARSMAFDAKDNLIVGTEPGGLILRVSPAGEGFVLHQSSKREITAVAVGKDGSVYAAAVGNKQPATMIPAAVTPVPAAGASTGGAALARGQAVPPPALAVALPTVTGGAEVYRIDSDGAPRRVWQHSTDIVYAIGFDAADQVLLGTGNKGRIYRLESERLHTNLVASTSTQITAMLTSKRGAIYAVTANIGKLFQLGPAMEKDGTVESEVYDAGAFSFWGRARYEGKAEGGAVALETRSGNLDRPQKNWSAWAPVRLNASAGRMGSPAARFLQYRLQLSAAENGVAPQVSLVELAYLTKNMAPLVEEIETTPANYRFPASSVSSTSAPTLSLPPMGQRRRGGSLSLDTGGSSMNYAKGHIGARWRAADDNGDSLVFKVEIRGMGEKDWKLLKDNVKERSLSWDSTAFADGNYQVRVTASDSLSNPPAQALGASLESDSFLIDNTPPRIGGLTAAMENGKLVVRFKANDAHSVIEKAEYSVNGGDWLLAQPVTWLADSLELDYVVTVERPAAGEVVIAVRVADEFENQAVDKTALR